jgi:hypothetical protein
MVIDREKKIMSMVPDHPTQVTEYFLGKDKPQLAATYTLQADGTVACDEDNDFMAQGVWDPRTDSMVLPTAGEAFLKALFLMQLIGNSSMVSFSIQ